MGKALGIHPGKGGAALVLLSGSAGRARLLAPDAPGPEGGLPKAAVVLALPEGMVKIRRIFLPFSRKDRIAKALRFQAERFLPGISPEELLLGHMVIRSDGDGSDLLLAMARKEEVKGLLESLGFAGVRPALVIPAWAALFHLLSVSGRLPRKGKWEILFFLEDVILLLLVEEGVPFHVRRIPAAGGGGSRASRVAGETRLTLAAAGVEDPLEGILVAAPLPGDLDLDDLEAQTGLPAAAVDLLAGFRDRWKGKGPLSAPALGAALAGLGRRGRILELREREPEEAGFYERARTPILLGVFFLVLWLAFSLMGTMTARGKTEEYCGDLSRRARSLFHRFVKGRKPRFSSTFDQTLENLARRKRESGTGGNWESFLDFISLLTRHLPVDQRRVILSVNFKGGKATLRGEADDVTVLDALAHQLEQSGEFMVRTPFRMRGANRAGRRKPLAFTIELSPRRKR